MPRGRAPRPKPVSIATRQQGAGGQAARYSGARERVLDAFRSEWRIEGLSITPTECACAKIAKHRNQGDSRYAIQTDCCGSAAEHPARLGHRQAELGRLAGRSDRCDEGG